MAAFPVSPVNGQQATVNGVIYTYSSSVTAWQVTSAFNGNVTVNQLNANTITSAGALAGLTLVVGNITNVNGNGIGNIGNSSVYFNTAHIRSTSAQYADLAEYYVGDQDYAVGTVVSFGGSKEVTKSTRDQDTSVAGVVSDKPAYIMNAGISVGDGHAVMVALQGRVKCQVRGKIQKGDLMVSSGDGTARNDPDARAGSIIGKSLEDFEGPRGTIEIVIGRT